MFSLGMTADTAVAHQQHVCSPIPRIAIEHGSSLVRQVLRHTSLPPLEVDSDVLDGSSDKRKSLPAMMRNQSSYGSSDEEQSRSNSLQSQTAHPGPITTKKKDRRKTSFQLAHPPPVIKQKKKLRIRPKLLLQLQLLSEGSRPNPALDVLPATIFAPRLASKFPRAFKGKSSLGTNDLIIVTSESYEVPRAAADDDKSDSSEEEVWDHRQVVATICQLPKIDGARGKVEIAFNQGTSWEGTPLPNGAFEFISTDQHGLQSIARWVPRNKTRRRTSTLSPSPATGNDDEKKFTFSLVDPNTRRHPVIASMTRNSVDVFDQYPSSASASPKSPGTIALSPSSITTPTSYFDALDLPGQTMIQTDDYLRTLIVVTGVWVAFREGWSKNFSYANSLPTPTGLATNVHLPHRRHVSNGPETPRQQQEGDSADLRSRGGLHHMSDNIRRTSTHLLRRSSPAPPAPPAESSRSGTNPAPPRRSFSTGAAFIEKANRRSLSLARKARQSYPAASGGESEEEHHGHTSGISTPSRPALRPSIGAVKTLSPTPDMDLAAKMAQKRRVQIEEPQSAAASDNVAVEANSIAKHHPTAESTSTGVGAENDRKPKKGWRRVSRIFSFMRRTSNSTDH